MNKDDLQKLIQKEIQTVAFGYLKDLKNQKQAQGTDDYLNSKNMTEDEFDAVFFFGGNKPKKEEKKIGPITIREGVDSNLRITTSEIKNFENSFKEILDNIPGASIVFDKQKNGHSIVATKRADGVEAKASGILNLGDNGKLIWSYSILNGFNLNAQNLKLSQSNKTMFEALANHYDDWQKGWREKLNLPNSTEPINDGGQPASGQPTENIPGADIAQPNQSAPPVSGGGPGQTSAPAAN